MKKLLKGLFAALSAVVIVGLTSCLSGDGENSQTFAGEPLVVDSSSPTTVVVSRFGGSFYAPEMDTYRYNPGACLLASFKINYDDQPSASAYTLSEVGNLIELGQSRVTLSEDSTIVGYDGVIMGTQIAASSELIFIRNKVFFTVTQNSSQGESFKYNAVWLEDQFVQNSKPTLYLSAQIDGEANGSSNREGAVYFALDLADFVQASRSYIESDQLLFNIRYRVEDTKDGAPAFSKPILYKITIPKES